MHVIILAETRATSPTGEDYILTLAREPGKGYSIHQRGPGGGLVLHEGLKSERKALDHLVKAKRSIREGL